MLSFIMPLFVACGLESIGDGERPRPDVADTDSRTDTDVLPPGGGPDDPCGTEAVYTGLEPTCVGCHGSGATQPFFAGSTAFRSLLVDSSSYVIPGDPDGSELIRLLRGQGTGSYSQMPSAGDSFAELSDAGSTDMTLAEVEAWVGALDGCTEETVPVTTANAGALARRKTVEQIITTLHAQLGLSQDEVFPSSHPYGDMDHFGAYSPDAIPALEDASGYDIEETAHARYLALGGPHWLERRPRDNGLSPTFGHAFVGMVQAQCGLAVERQTPEIFAHVSSSSPSSTHETEIRSNIEALHLRMLGEPASAEDTAALLDVFRTYEPEGTETAWVALCATLARDPLWLTY